MSKKDEAKKKEETEVYVGEVVEEKEKNKVRALFDKFKTNTILRAAMMIVVGLVLIVFPSETQKSIAFVISAILVIFGLVHIIRYFRDAEIDENGNKQFGSLADLVIGVILMVLAGLLATLLISVIPIVLGILIIVSGLIKLEQGLTLKRANSSDANFVIIVAAVTIAVGLFAVFNPFSIGNVLLIILGAGMLVSGITDLIAAGRISKIAKLADDDLSKY